MCCLCRGNEAEVGGLIGGQDATSGSRLMSEAVQVQIWKQRMDEIKLRLQEARKLSPMDFEGLKAEYSEIERLVRTFSN